MRRYLYVFMHECLCVCVCVCVFMYVHLCTNGSSVSYRKNVHACMRSRAHIHTPLYMHFSCIICKFMYVYLCTRENRYMHRMHTCMHAMHCICVEVTSFEAQFDQSIEEADGKRKYV